MQRRMSMTFGDNCVVVVIVSILIYAITFRDALYHSATCRATFIFFLNLYPRRLIQCRDDNREIVKPGFHKSFIISNQN